MKEHPILFSGPLVRAILDGRKTQTRRLIRSRQPKPGFAWRECLCGDIDPTDRPCLTCSVRYGLEEPKYKVGDRLWVRETWRTVGWAPERRWQLAYQASLQDRPTELVEAPKDWEEPLANIQRKWVPSIHMPRWASRLTLEVVESRSQRIQDITDADIRAEGILEGPLNDPRPGAYRGQFQVAWEQIYRGTWAENAWVWAVSFKRVQG